MLQVSRHFPNLLGLARANANLYDLPNTTPPWESRKGHAEHLSWEGVLQSRTMYDHPSQIHNLLVLLPRSIEIIVFLFHTALKLLIFV
jgi:hypothetical protein